MGFHWRNLSGLLYLLDRTKKAGRAVKKVRQLSGSLQKKNTELKLTDKETKLFEIIRRMEFGEVRVIVTDGIPTRVEEIKKSIKLSNNKIRKSAAPIRFLAVDFLVIPEISERYFLHNRNSVAPFMN